LQSRWDRGALSVALFVVGTQNTIFSNLLGVSRRTVFE
jgi:hypothetical protein